MKTPRIVIDSNVFISGLFFGGPPARVLAHLIEGAARCFISIPILDEIRHVLKRSKFGLTPDQSVTILEELHALCEVVTPSERIRVIEADPDDNMILECAAEAEATLIVSGDSHLLDLSVWRGIRIPSPTGFLKIMEEKDKS